MARFIAGQCLVMVLSICKHCSAARSPASLDLLLHGSCCCLLAAAAAALLPATLPLVNPTDNPEFKRRIVGALGLLVTAKVLQVQVGKRTQCELYASRQQNTLWAVCMCEQPAILEYKVDVFFLLYPPVFLPLPPIPPQPWFANLGFHAFCKGSRNTVWQNFCQVSPQDTLPTQAHSNVT